ncbi:MAG: hypothetical protein J7578_22305, partial [Chitinophagaceae bacterium]|nr:hypothetical protein [Chitinophagaceae bacterium]
DGVAELVVAYDMRKRLNENDEHESVPRELIIYKKQKGKWIIWKRSRQALAGSRDGGMMGDPYGEMSISKGILTISHSGGTGWKWNNTDKYRYLDGDLFLIGNINSYGRPCEYFMEADFNLSTGKLVVSKDFQNCESLETPAPQKETETVIAKGYKITLAKRNDTDIVIRTPKYGYEISISIKTDEND